MRRRYIYMPIDAKPGTKVYFWKPNNGWPGDVELSKKLGLKRFAEYTVDHTDIYSTSTTLWLREFPGVGFNTVQFAVDRAALRRSGE